jgi:hypothetical protein
MATKTSILCFYLTLARNQKLFRWANWATLIVVNIAGLGLTLLNVFQCRPMSTLFWPVIPDFAVCTDLVVIYLSSAPVNIVTDLAILVLPFPVLTNMRLPKKQKIILIITFSFGAFVAVVDVIRIAYLQQAFETRLKEVGKQNSATSKALQQDDFSWYASLSFMWSAIEVHIGIICACVPSLKPLVARVMPSMLRDISDPNDQSIVIKEESKMQSLNFMSASTASPPLSPGQTRSKDARHFANLDAEPALARISPPESSNSKEKPADDEDGSAEAQGSSDSADANDTTAAAAKTESGGSAPEGDMDFMEFLTTPDMASPHRLARPNTVASTTTTTSTIATSGRRGSVPFFDFYQMERKKPMTRLSNRQALAPLVAATVLFFLW